MSAFIGTRSTHDWYREPAADEDLRIAINLQTYLWAMPRSYGTEVCCAGGIFVKLRNPFDEFMEAHP